MTLIPVVSTPSAMTNFEVTPFNIGETSILSTFDDGNANLLLAQSATLTDAAVVRGMSFYVVTAGGQLRLGIYDATGPGGGPGALRAQTALMTPVVGWNSALVTTPVMFPAGTYWLAYHPSSNTLAFRKGNGSPSRYYTRAFAALPATFATVTSSTPSHWSCYATFEGSAAMSQRFMLLALTQTPPPPTGGFPEGVTLQAIDGGANYYADKGFTYASNAGWDSPTFFPIGVWYALIATQAAATRYLDLNMNTCFRTTGNTLNSLLRTNGIWAIEEPGETTDVGVETVGLLAYDEPTTLAQCYGLMESTLNTVQDNRFWFINNTYNFVAFGDIEGTDNDVVLADLRATPNATERHLDIQAMDIYWCAGAASTAIKHLSQLIYGLGSDFTDDQVRRGIHNGQMIDFLRPIQTGNFPAPIYQFAENGGPYTEDTTAASYITPPEMDATVWSAIIHGARGIMYFNHSFAGPAVSSDNFAQNYYQTIQSGNSISIYDQAKATNALIMSLATVINSPFAVGYVSVSPAPSSISDFVGSEFDVMAKYHNVSGGDNKFYIFAMPRYSGATADQTATFTIKNTGATQVTVINESRTISITSGTTFTDNFATGHTVHIYRVD